MAGSFAQKDHFASSVCYTACGGAAGRRADEGCVIAGQRFHSRLVAEDAASRDGARRVTASTATVFPSRMSCSPSVLMKLLLPTPGAPEMPIRKDSFVVDRSRRSNSSPCSISSARALSTSVIAWLSNLRSRFRTPSSSASMLGREVIPICLASARACRAVRSQRLARLSPVRTWRHSRPRAVPDGRSWGSLPRR